MNLTVVHISDVHIRGKERHEEYKTTFNLLIEQIKQLRDNTPTHKFVSILTGDLWHTKTLGLTAEYVKLLSDFLTMLADVSEHVYVTLGNHDGILGNLTKLDAVSPIIEAMSHERVTVFVKSGVYDILNHDSGYKLCLFSLFDRDGWKDVKPVPGCMNIASYHGPVNSAMTNIGWTVKDMEMDVDFFNDFDVTMLGDIHKWQVLKKVNGIPTVAYPGSLIQQDYGESVDEHGFLLWTFDNRKMKELTFHEVKNLNPLVTIDAANIDIGMSEIKHLDELHSLRVKVTSDEQFNTARSNDIKQRILKIYPAFEVIFSHKMKNVGDVSKSFENAKSLNLRDKDTLMQMFDEYCEDEQDKENVKASQGKLSGLLDSVCAATEESSSRGTVWSLEMISFSNTFAYGADNFVNLSNKKGVIAIVGPNGSGKSSFIGTILYALHNTSDRGSVKAHNVINDKCLTAETTAQVSLKGKQYVIKRTLARKKNNRTQTTATLELSVADKDGDLVNLRGDERRDTEKTIRALIGTSQDCLRTSISAQNDNENQLAFAGPTDRFKALSRFIDLGVLEELHQQLNVEFNVLKSCLKTYDNCETELTVKRTEYDELLVSEKELNDTISKLDSVITNLRMSLSEAGDDSQITDNDLLTLERQYETKKASVVRDRKLLTREQSLVPSDDMIKLLESDVSQDSLTEINKKLMSIISTMSIIKESKTLCDSARNKLNVVENTVSLLTQVPCGDKFLDCKFISNAHLCKTNMHEQVDALAEAVKDSAAIVKNAVKQFDVKEESELTSKKKQLTDESTLVEKKLKELNSLREQVAKSSKEINRLQQQLSKDEDALELMNANIERLREMLSSDTVSLTKDLKNKLSQAQKTKDGTVDKLIKISKSVGSCKLSLENLEKKCAEKIALLTEYSMTELLTSAFSRKGIPTRIIAKCVPALNEEIRSILAGVVDFTVELSIDTDTSSVGIDLVTDDSRRPIELVCGMEKFYSQLAVRCAMITLSSLPKLDTFFIDEGFGSLDQEHITTTQEFLRRLSDRFGRVVIITHVSGIRESVDTTIDVQTVDKKAQLVIL